MARPTATVSLKARAVGLLSRREHSRSELRRKLAPHCDDPSVLEALLDDLERGNWLSEERFAESLAHRHAPRHGVRRIMQELRRHQLPEEAVAGIEAELRGTEFERARAVWNKRFGAPPADAREFGRQCRYMLARGFTAETLRRILAEHGDGVSSELLPPDDPFD
jgi:regulatory protein